jgi:hypothetical protein
MPRSREVLERQHLVMAAVKVVLPWSMADGANVHMRFRSLTFAMLSASCREVKTNSVVNYDYFLTASAFTLVMICSEMFWGLLRVRELHSTSPGPVLT